MPLVIQLARTGYAVALDELRFADQTGLYDALTKPGGWGGPNPARAANALYLTGELMRSDGNPGARVFPLPSDAGNPLSRTEFTLRPGLDGYLRASLLSIPADFRPALNAALGAGAIPDGQLRYDRTNSQLVVCRAGAWLPATLADAPLGAYELAASAEALTPRAQALRDRLTERVAGLYYDGQSEAYANAGDQHLLRLHAATKALLAAADICWQRAQPSLFALRVERLNALSGEINALLA